jgi:hypothetical protein
MPRKAAPQQPRFAGGRRFDSEKRAHNFTVNFFHVFDIIITFIVRSVNSIIK